MPVNEWLFEIGAGSGAWWWCYWLACLDVVSGSGFVLVMGDTYRSNRRRVAAQCSCRRLSFRPQVFCTCCCTFLFFCELIYSCGTIQFLGRDKDDGVRRSAVSGKKVHAELLQFSIVMWTWQSYSMSAGKLWNFL